MQVTKKGTDSSLKCTNISGGRVPPGPAGGAYNAPPDSLAGCRRSEDGKGREGREGRKGRGRRGGKRKGDGGKRKGDF